MRLALIIFLGIGLCPVWGAAASTRNFLEPNETHPLKVLPLIARAPRGSALVTVGTERGFITASLADSPVGSLVLVDKDPQVVRFNQINRALLRAARDRAEYLSLRLNADSAQWNAVVDGSPELDAETKAWMRSQWSWWRDNVRNGQFRPFHSEGGEFAGANYLYSDRLFGKLQAMARAGKIDVRQVDLQDAGKVQAMVQDLAREGVRVGVLDLSNSYWDWFIGDDRIVALTKELAPLTDPRSVLVLSGWRSPQQEDFGYFGFTFGWLGRSGADYQLSQTLEALKKGGWPYFRRYLEGSLYGGPRVQAFLQNCGRYLRSFVAY